MNNNRHITVLKGLLIVLAGSLLISIGIWHCSVPLGDEAGYISNAIALINKGEYSLNLYLLNYILLLKFVSPDPIVVHTICRFYTSIFSCIFMYFFLASFKRIGNNYGLLITCALWTCCTLNIPKVQFGNINLFALNIVFPALILIMRKITISRALFLLLSLLWAVQTRIEYLVPLSLTLLIFAYFAFKFLRGKNWKISFSKKHINSVLLFLLILFSIAVIKLHKGKSFADLDQHLLLGLEQCYTSLYSKFHPDEKISTMVEYNRITDKVFNKPTGFIDASIKNPAEVIKYLLVNGSINSVILIPALLRHRNFFVPEKLGKKGEIIEISILLFFIGLGGVIGLKKIKKTEQFNLENALTLLKHPKVLILLALGGAASISILLLIPDGRYWITVVPILYLFIFWSISQLYAKIKSSKIRLALFLIIFIIFLHPLFIGLQNNRGIIKKMRLAYGNNSLKPLIAGLYPEAIGTYAFGLNKEIFTVNDISTDDIKNNKYDFFVITSYLRNSMFWEENSDFMKSFEKNPAQYRQKKLGTTSDKYKLAVYSKT